MTTVTQLPDLSTSMSAILFRLASWSEDDDRELPRRGHGYRPDMTPAELYDSVRAWWVLNPQRAERYQYAVAVHDGVTRGVWEIDHATWRQASPETARRLGRSRRRWSFQGKRPSAAVEEEFVGRIGLRVPRTRLTGENVFGIGSVVAYWPRRAR